MLHRDQNPWSAGKMVTTGEKVPASTKWSFYNNSDSWKYIVSGFKNSDFFCCQESCKNGIYLSDTQTQEGNKADDISVSPGVEKKSRHYKHRLVFYSKPMKSQYKG